MDTLPPAKPPGEFTGQGLEIIGNPDDFFSECASLVFEDGRLLSIGLPARIIIPKRTIVNADEDSPEYRFYRATRLADLIAQGNASETERMELKKILHTCRYSDPREGRTEQAVSRIKNKKAVTITDAGFAHDSSRRLAFQNTKQQLALACIQDLARELKRPPKKGEVVVRMIDFEAPTGRVIQSKDTPEVRKELRKFLRDIGFGWLQKGESGRPKKRNC